LREREPRLREDRDLPAKTGPHHQIWRLRRRRQEPRAWDTTAGSPDLGMLPLPRGAPSLGHRLRGREY
jgi:hypothetical protein